MRNLVWMGTILVILGAAGVGLHEVDHTEAGPAQALARTAPPARSHDISLSLAGSIGLLAAGLGMVFAGRRAR